jgi:hypothetical protein
MPVKFLTDVGVTRGAFFPLSLLYICTRKILKVKKQELEPQQKKSKI